MPISHPCVSCGSDLAAVRARTEPHYGLPLVTCPACGDVFVRRPHPLSCRWRSILRGGGTLIVLALQLAAVAGAVSLIASICIGIGDDVARGRLAGVPRRELVVVSFVAFIVVPIALGAWLTGGLHHWRRPVAWGVFTAVLAAVCSADVIVGPAALEVLNAAGVTDFVRPYRPDRFVVRLALLGVVMVVALGGIPLGRWLRTLVRATHVSVRRRGRRRGDRPMEIPA
jgi:hypothetical protein